MSANGSVAFNTGCGILIARSFHDCIGTETVFDCKNGFLSAFLTSLICVFLLDLLRIIKKGNLFSLAVLGVVFVLFILIQMAITRKSRRLIEA